MINSTQQSVDIAGIKDGVVIMKDGSYRIILQTSPVNFALKSEQEQTSLIFQYQSFLNSLHFPIEIVVRSKRLDLTPYLKKIRDITKSETNELIKVQAADYIDFVEKLINIANIMKKSFFVAVSYNPVTVKQVGFFDKLFGKKEEIYDHIKISDQEFKSCTDKLKERANIVASGLGGMGLHCFQLSTEELIELFYQVYNPDESSKERIDNMDILASPIIASKDEMTAAAQAQTNQNTGNNSGMIDNSQIVAAQRKQEAEVRKLETENDAEKEIEKAEKAATTPSAESTNDEKTSAATTQPTTDTTSSSSNPETQNTGSNQPQLSNEQNTALNNQPTATNRQVDTIGPAQNSNQTTNNG